MLASSYVRLFFLPFSGGLGKKIHHPGKPSDWPKCIDSSDIEGELVSGEYL